MGGWTRLMGVKGGRSSCMEINGTPDFIYGYNVHIYYVYMYIYLYVYEGATDQSLLNDNLGVRSFYICMHVAY